MNERINSSESVFIDGCSTKELEIILLRIASFHELLNSNEVDVAMSQARSSQDVTIASHVYQLKIALEIEFVLETKF